MQTLSRFKEVGEVLVSNFTPLGESHSIPQSFDINVLNDVQQNVHSLPITKNIIDVWPILWNSEGINIWDTRKRLIWAILNICINYSDRIYGSGSSTAMAECLVLSNDLNQYGNITSTRVFTISAIVGQYNVLTPVDDDDEILSVLELHGLHVSWDKKSVVGVVGFTNQRVFNIKTVKRVNYIITVVPTYVERLL